MGELRDLGLPDQKSKSRGGRRAPGPRGLEVTLPALPLLQDIMKHLTLEELTDLIWATINGLGSTGPCHVQAAADMLLTMIREHGAKLDTVRELGTRRGSARTGRGAEGRPGGRTQGLQPLGQGSGGGDADPAPPRQTPEMEEVVNEWGPGSSRCARALVAGRTRTDQKGSGEGMALRLRERSV